MDEDIIKQDFDALRLSREGIELLEVELKKPLNGSDINSASNAVDEVKHLRRVSLEIVEEKDTTLANIPVSNVDLSDESVFQDFKIHRTERQPRERPTVHLRQAMQLLQQLDMKRKRDFFALQTIGEPSKVSGAVCRATLILLDDGCSHAPIPTWKKMN